MINRVLIGFDERQQISFTALQQSIVARTSEPVAIIPIVLRTLPITRSGLTPFTFSRFLTPWLCDYEGWAQLNSMRLARSNLSWVSATMTA